MKSQPIILDAGMGFRLPRPTALVNLTHPDRVLRIHRSHIRAGSDIILTNTFGCADLSKSHRQRSLKAGVRLAKKAAGDEVLIFGSLGPAMDGQALKECVGLLIKNDVDGIFFETFFSTAQVEQALIIAKKIKIPVFLSMTVNDRGKLLDGTSPLSLIKKIEKAGIAAVGFNCSTGPASLLKPLTLLAKKTRIPLIAKPNAGLPPLKPQEYARQMKRIINAGASIIGGCCGTTGGHLSATVHFLDKPKC